MSNLKINICKNNQLMGRTEITIHAYKKDTEDIVLSLTLQQFIGKIIHDFDNLYDEIRRLKNKVSVLEEKSTPPRS